MGTKPKGTVPASASGRSQRKRSKPLYTLSRLFLALVAVVALVWFAKSWETSRHSESEGERTGSEDDLGALLESRESLYNNIYVYRKGTYLSMKFGHNTRLYEESLYNTVNDLELPSPYTPFMTASTLYPVNIKSILEIGSGGGRTAWYLHHFLPDVQITTVEIDPDVVKLSRKYFNVREEPNFRVITEDGRMFLATSKERYDIVLLDAYRGPFVPFHLLTQEFYELVKSHLADGGVVAQNVEPSTMLFDSAVKTMLTVFGQVEFYDAGNGHESALNRADVGANIVVIAYDGESRSSSDLSRVADERQSMCRFAYDLRTLLLQRYLLKRVGPSYNVVNQSGFVTAGIDDNAKILSDDFAPVESLKAIARHNQKWTFQNQ